MSATRHKGLASDLRVGFAASDRKQALGTASTVAERWHRKGYSKVTEHLEDYLEECLTCLIFPGSHRRHIRTTNGRELVSQEIKRRSRVVRIFPNGESCLRLVSTLAAEVSEEWVTGRRYLGMRELKESTAAKSRKQRRWHSWSGR